MMDKHSRMRNKPEKSPLFCHFRELERLFREYKFYLVAKSRLESENKFRQIFTASI